MVNRASGLLPSIVHQLPRTAPSRSTKQYDHEHGVHHQIQDGQHHDLRTGFNKAGKATRQVLLLSPLAANGWSLRATARHNDRGRKQNTDQPFDELNA